MNLNGKTVDEKTMQALTEIDVKLGTTAEYLWGVLINQAFIEGVIDLLIMVALAALSCLLFVFVRRKTGGNYPLWNSEAVYTTAWGFACLFCFTAVLWIATGINDAVTAIVNPEYWALNEILKR